MMNRALILPVGADNPEAPPESPNILTALTLEAALREAGTPADVFFYFNEKWPSAKKRLLEKVVKNRYPLIGLSFLSYNRIETYELLRELSSVVPQCRLILGGAHASFLYEQLLRNFPNVKAVAIGEGEKALVEFSRNPNDLASVPGIAYLDEKGDVRVNPPDSDQDRKLDSLPFVDYSLLRDYKGSIPLQTTRGCTAKCIFCTFRIMESKIRTKSPERIVKEFSQIRDLFGPDRRIAVLDALYNVSLGHVKGMCRALVEAGLTSNPWDAELRVKPVDLEMLNLMKEAGCKRVLLGVETGNETIRKNIGKAVLNEDIRKIFDLAHKAKMPTLPFLITALPGENDETVKETIDFIHELNPYYVVAGVPAQALPGSGLCRIMKQRGLINDDYWLYEHPKNWGDASACGNMPIFTAEQNILQIMNWVGQTHKGLAEIPSFASVERLIMNDEEYDRYAPVKNNEIPAKLRELLVCQLPGSLKARARRLVRDIRMRLLLAATKLKAGQKLAITITIKADRVSDLYLFILSPGEDLSSIIPSMVGPQRVTAIKPFFQRLEKDADHVLVEMIDAFPFPEHRGRHLLVAVLCSGGASILDKEKWLDWKRIRISVE